MKNVWNFLTALLAVVIILPIGSIIATMTELNEKQEEKEHE